MATVDCARYPVTIDVETVQVGTAGELAMVLDVLQGQHDRQVLEQLAPHLAGILGGPTGLKSTLKSLAPPDQLFLIEALGPRLGELIPTAGHLRDLLAMLADPGIEERLLVVLGTAGLRRLIVTAAELAEALEWVYGRCDRMVLELLGAERLSRLFADGQELSRVLHSLDGERQAWLLQQLGWERVRSLLAGGRDLAYLLRALPPALSELILQRHTRDQLVALIGNARDWDFLCDRLEAAELNMLFARLGVDGDA